MAIQRLGEEVAVTRTEQLTIETIVKDLETLEVTAAEADRDSLVLALRAQRRAVMALLDTMQRVA